MYTAHEWKKEGHAPFRYAQYLPKGFHENERYPLVLFLHGAGERGDDLDVACRHGFMKHVRESGKEYPFICVAPQCPFNEYWGHFTESLLAFLDHICDTLPVDRDRVYLTGFSMGGFGTWLLAMAEPSRFAAIAPICGSGISWNAWCVRNLPIMMYHGDEDTVVPVWESVDMLNALRRNGAVDATLHILPGVGHNAWDAAYEGDHLTEWFLSKAKK